MTSYIIPLHIFILAQPFIIEDTFMHCIVVLAPEDFTISVEFVIICVDFNITWKLNGNQIVNDGNHVIVNTDLSNSRYRTSVKIVKSSIKDSGTYTVIVTAATGSDSAKITVKVISKIVATNYFYSIMCSKLAL